MECAIEFMKPEDWEEVRAIYVEGIETGNATFQESAPSWTEWDREHISSCRLVARHGGRVCGWAALSPYTNRDCFSGVAEVSLYTGREFRRKGIGKKLLESLITESEGEGFWTLYSGIFPENEASIALHRKCGFKLFCVGEKLGRTRDGIWRDVVYMSRRSAKVF